MRRSGSIRSGSIVALLVMFWLPTGGVSYAYDTGVADKTVHETAPPDPLYRRANRDVRGYVRHLDRHLHLNKRQEQRIHRLLKSRTSDLLERTRHYTYARVYPFPRTHSSRITRRWWNETDRRIENHLSRRQVRAYRALTRHYDYGVYEDRNDRNDPYNRQGRQDRYDRRHRD